MLTVTVFPRPHTAPPVAASPDDMPTRFFTVAGAVWGKTSQGDIVDVYGNPADPAQAPHLLIRINTFLAARA